MITTAIVSITSGVGLMMMGAGRQVKHFVIHHVMTTEAVGDQLRAAYQPKADTPEEFVQLFDRIH